MTLQNRAKMYPEAGLIIGGVSRSTGSAGVLEVTDPATDEVLAVLPKAGLSEVSEACETAMKGFAEWSAFSPYDRSKILRRAADLMRARTEDAARCLTLEQGKPLAQARLEWGGAADLLEWFAEEGRRTYGRIIPGRVTESELRVLRKPVGPVAALAPWNFPAWGMMQKIAPALAAGCSVVAKPSEATPVTTWHIAVCLLEAGLPPNAISVIWGSSSTLSDALIKSPEIRKVSLTGSTRVGRIVASLAGGYLKKMTIELGGHAPVIVARDADMSKLIPLAAQWKFRNAGQVCVSPTRFLVEDAVYDDFVEGLSQAAARVKGGHGLGDGGAGRVDRRGFGRSQPDASGPCLFRLYDQRPHGRQNHEDCQSGDAGGQPLLVWPARDALWWRPGQRLWFRRRDRGLGSLHDAYACVGHEIGRAHVRTPVTVPYR